MSSLYRRFFLSAKLCPLKILIGLLVAAPPVVAQDSGQMTARAWTDPDAARPNAQGSIAPSALLHVPAAQLRIAVEMDLAEAQAPLETAAAPEPFMPTLGTSAYRAAKAAALLRAPREQRTEASPETEAEAAPIYIGPAFEGLQRMPGVSNAANPHGAVGRFHFLQVGNRRVNIYTRDGELVRSVSLASFFGYSLKPLSKPRAVYDKTWDRFIVTVTARAESSTIQRHFIAVSRTNDPTGAYLITNINVTKFAGSGNGVDFSQLGFDQDSVIITINVFGPSFLGWRMVSIAKAKLYNGLSFTMPVFAGAISDGTLAPPLVLDNNPRTFLIAAPPGGSALKLYALTNSNQPATAKLTGPVSIRVSPYAVPPEAFQCGAYNKLITGDARFVNASSQVGNHLWNVHSIDVGGRAGVRWYRVNTSSFSVNKSNTFYASADSHDFYASVAANELGDIFLVWTSTSTSVCPQIRYSGQRFADPSATGKSGKVLFTSPTYFNPDLWGRYSAVTVDPLSPLRAWVVAEKVNALEYWGTGIGQIGWLR